jgi:hypothetical protein
VVVTAVPVDNETGTFAIMAIEDVTDRSGSNAHRLWPTSATN